MLGCRVCFGHAVLLYYGAEELNPILPLACFSRSRHDGFEDDHGTRRFRAKVFLRVCQ